VYFPGRVVDIEVSDPDVGVGPVAGVDRSAPEDRLPALLLGAPRGLELLGRRPQCRDRRGIDRDAETHRHRVAVADRLLDEAVIGRVEPVGDRDHVVEAREEHVAATVPHELGEVGVET